MTRGLRARLMVLVLLAGLALPAGRFPAPPW